MSVICLFYSEPQAYFVDMTVAVNYITILQQCNPQGSCGIQLPFEPSVSLVIDLWYA